MKTSKIIHENPLLHQAKHQIPNFHPLICSRGAKQFPQVGKRFVPKCSHFPRWIKLVSSPESEEEEEEEEGSSLCLT